MILTVETCRMILVENGLRGSIRQAASRSVMDTDMLTLQLALNQVPAIISSVGKPGYIIPQSAQAC